jgi:Zn finger protein HypA/HybF involved in hydrogenase expression
MSELTKNSKRLKNSFMLYIARRKDIKIIPEIRTVTDKANFECLKCNYVWETYPYILKRRKSGCSKCAKRDEIERYKTRFKQFLREEKLELLSELKGYRENITVKCRVCTKEWESYPMRLKTASSKGCTDCNAEKRRIKKEKEFKKYLKTRDDLELIGNFKKNYVKAKFKCLICTHKWNAFPDVIKKSRGCPKCKLSRGEKNIEKHLNVQNVKYITQWSIINVYIKESCVLTFICQNGM